MTEHHQERNIAPCEEQWLTKKRCALLLAAICLVCVTLDLFFFNGFFASDDRIYFTGAARVAETGHLGEPLLGHTRLTVLGWNVLVGSLCRFDVQVMAGSYIFFHLWLVLLTYLLAERLGNRLAGIIAAYVTATFPLFIIVASGIYPDLPLTCFLVLSLMAFLNVYRARARGRVFVAACWMLLSGILVGFSYMAKEAALPALAFYFFAWLMTEIRHRPRATAAQHTPPDVEPAPQSPPAPPSSPPPRWIGRAIITGAPFAIGFFLVFGAEYKLLSHLVGRPFFRLAWVNKEDDMQSIRNFHRDGGYDPIKRLEAARDRLTPEFYPYDSTAELVLLALVLVAYALSKKRSWPLLLLGLWMFAYLTWGTYSHKHYYPPRIQARYYIPAFPFLIAVFGITLSRGVEFFRKRLRPGRPRRALGATAATALILIPLAHLQGPDRRAGRIYRTDFVKLTAAAIHDANRQQADQIVVSRQIASRVGQIWYRGLPREDYAERPDNVIMSRDLQTVGIDRLLAGGGFHYIEILREIELSVRSGCVQSFDQLLHPALANRLALRAPPPDRNPRNVVYLDALTFACTEPDSLGIVGVGRYELVPSLTARQDRVYKTRTKEVAHRLTNNQMAGRRYFAKAKAIIDTYRVNVRPVSVESEPVRDLLATTTGWQVSEDTADISRSENGRLDITIDDETEDAILVTPEYGPGASQHLELPARRRCRLKIDLVVTDGLTVDCVLVIPTGDDTDEQERPLRIRLQNGINEIGLYTKGAPRHVTPTFEVTGQGTVTIKSMQSQIQRIQPD